LPVVEKLAYDATYNKIQPHGRSFYESNSLIATVIASLSCLICLYVLLQAELGETQIDTSDAFNDIRPPRVIAALRQERKGRKQDGRRHQLSLAHAGKCIGSSQTS
jgi:hypothetical protein